MMKKKAFAVLAALLFSVSLFAQSGVNVQNKNIKQQFTEVRRLADGSGSVLQGLLEYRTDGYLSMTYDNGELFLIDGNTMTINRDGVKQSFDISKNMMMKSLSHALMLSFQGKLDELAEEQQASIMASKEDGCDVFTLTASKKQVRGYSMIKVSYRSGIICKMQMDEFTGASTLYTLK